MQIVQKNHATTLTPSPSTEIIEFQMDEQSISGAIAKINGRYPEYGFATNATSKELVYVISGSGKIVTTTSQTEFFQGDSILISANEQYYWEGNFTIFMANTPKFNPKQHLVIR